MKRSGSVLVRKDGGLPETGLDDGGTAELDSFIQPIQHLDSGLPVDASISDADTILESRRAIFRDVLSTGVDVRLDHDTSNSAVTGDQLFTDRVNNLWLVIVVLHRVSMGAVDHDARLVLRTRLLKSSTYSLDVLSSVVGTLGTTSENNVDVLVSGGLDDSSQTLLGDTHESMGVGGRLHGIDSNTDASVGPVLETDREGDTGSELTVELGLGGTCSNSTPRDEIGNVLR